MKNKKYLLFAGSYYYPNGGMEDLQFSADTIERCKQHFQRYARKISSQGVYVQNWGQIVERETLVIVLYGKIHNNEDWSLPKAIWLDSKNLNRNDKNLILNRLNRMFE